MWHASIAPRYTSVAVARDRLVDIAHDELRGVGDLNFEWIEIGDHAVHVRRRLAARESLRARLDVIDVRGTPEHERRIAAMRPYLPPVMRNVPWVSLP